MRLRLANFLVRRLVLTALTGGVGFFAALSHPCHGQDLSWRGLNEGSVIQLPAGMASTNLTLEASPNIPIGSANLVFILERQGRILLSLTSAPPYEVTLTNLSSGKYFLTAMLQDPTVAPIGDLSFDIEPAVLLPANDDWAQAAVLQSPGGAVTGSNFHATREANEPNLGGGGSGKSIWWAWTADSSGIFTVTTAGSSFDTLLGVYSGTNLATLVALAENDDIGPHAFSQITFSATSGATYYFLVDGATGSNGGEVWLRLLARGPPSISITAPSDGFLALLESSTQATNVTVAIAALDPSGIARLEYWFDGGTNLSRSGVLSPPYQLSLPDLFAGHYWLTVAASNQVGLVSVTNAGFSVISLEPVLSMERLASMPGEFQLGLTGFKGPNYTLQTSSNLDVWCGVNTWTNFAGAVRVTATNTFQARPRFFRATTTP